MVDLVHETPLRIRDAAEMFRVHPKTIEKWFRYGLERTDLGGLVYTSKEAIQRFSKPSNNACDTNADGDAAKAMHELETRFGVGRKRIGRNRGQDNCKAGKTPAEVSVGQVDQRARVAS